ncbi:hypothetical protein [Nonomuraea soli]|uniref:Uncharacterized protein n=1 Tax=Nonomuraea soli TaxID=1032476 RepID=A0A7W0CNT0_9ACTN|nr:hypothetical protein [Nonomuraea soli]MBA2894552.1 hypothetical protein [Nonomuraea soli]
MELDAPDLAWLPATMTADARVTRGRPRPAPVRGAVTLGRPVVQPLTEELAAGDPPLRAFLAEQGGAWRFHLVHLGCSFLPEPGARFAQAWLTVRLARADGVPEPVPIAWSLDPLRSERPVEQTTTVKIGAKAVLEAGVEVSTTGSRTEVFLTAYGLQEDTCTWEFTRTAREEIRGGQRLALVARTPGRALAVGEVELRATLVRRRLGVLPYRVALDGGEPLTFRLSGES